MKRWRHYKRGSAVLLSLFGSVAEQERYERFQSELSQSIQSELESHGLKLGSGIDLFSSCSSRSVLKAQELKGRELWTPAEQLARIDRLGYQRVVVASLNLFATDEHELLERTVEGFRHFSPAHYACTGALFTRVADCHTILNDLLAHYGDGPLFAIAHGAPRLDHAGGQALPYLRDHIREGGCDRFFATLEGIYPVAAELDRIARAAEEGRWVERGLALELMPLLLVHGRHFRDDIYSIAEKLSDRGVPLQRSEEGALREVPLLSLPSVEKIVARMIVEKIALSHYDV